MALKQLRKTFAAARGFRDFLRFMLAVLIYDDGIIMALDFAAIIGAVLFGMQQQGLIIFVIIVQITNVFGAYGFGILADRAGIKRSLTGSIIMMLGSLSGCTSARPRWRSSLSAPWPASPWPAYSR